MRSLRGAGGAGPSPHSRRARSITARPPRTQIPVTEGRELRGCSVIAVFWRGAAAPPLRVPSHGRAHKAAGGRGRRRARGGSGSLGRGRAQPPPLAGSVRSGGRPFAGSRAPGATDDGHQKGTWAIAGSFSPSFSLLPPPLGSLGSSAEGCGRGRRSPAARRGEGCGGGPGRAAARPFGGSVSGRGMGTAQFGRGCRRSRDRFLVPCAWPDDAHDAVRVVGY